MTQQGYYGGDDRNPPGYESPYGQVPAYGVPQPSQSQPYPAQQQHHQPPYGGGYETPNPYSQPPPPSQPQAGYGSGHSPYPPQEPGDPPPSGYTPQDYASGNYHSQQPQQQFPSYGQVGPYASGVGARGTYTPDGYSQPAEPLPLQPSAPHYNHPYDDRRSSGDPRHGYGHTYGGDGSGAPLPSPGQPCYDGGSVGPPGSNSTSTGMAPPGQEGERGLGTALLGATGGGIFGHKLGKGPIATVGGAIVGAMGANALKHHHDGKKKKKKDKYKDEGLAYGASGSGKKYKEKFSHGGKREVGKKRSSSRSSGSSSSSSRSSSSSASGYSSRS